MEDFEVGLRCQDVYAGLRNMDVTSAAITQHLEGTQLVGMAAALATTIRGEEVIGNADALRALAADRLDINTYAFPRVIRLLHDRGLVTNVRTSGSDRVVSFDENVPFHQDLYEALGGAWLDSSPDGVAAGMLETVQELARSPLAGEDLTSRLGISRQEADTILQVGDTTELVRVFPTPDGKILFSPFHVFENPQHLVAVFSKHGSDRVQEEFSRIQGHQGIPIGPSTPVLNDAVGQGLLLAPAVETPDGQRQPFAFLPYTIDRQYLTTKKAVLDKAIAILACIRCGQHFGGATRIRFPKAILAKLERGERLRPHTSSSRQYHLLYALRVVDIEVSGEWARVRLVDTEDNRQALGLARQLLEYGQQMSDRAGEESARGLLAVDGTYRTPLQTVRDRRKTVGLQSSELRKVIEALAMGRDAI